MGGAICETALSKGSSGALRLTALQGMGTRWPYALCMWLFPKAQVNTSSWHLSHSQAERHLLVRRKHESCPDPEGQDRGSIACPSVSQGSLWPSRQNPQGTAENTDSQSCLHTAHPSVGVRARPGFPYFPGTLTGPEATLQPSGILALLNITATPCLGLAARCHTKKPH